MQEEGYEVDVARSDADARAKCAEHRYDGIILDLQLGDRDGADVLRELRQLGVTTPVLIYTGKSDLDTITRLLDVGADGYIVKPVANAEICARVRALLRRSDSGKTREELKVGAVQLNRLTRRVTFGERELNLTTTEIKLLEYLMLNVRKTVSRTDLREKVWNMHFDPGSNMVDAHVARLRKKLHLAGADAEIHTRRGMGFMLTATNRVSTPA
jgi:DNA-binding response OmpR family regulator